MVAAVSGPEGATLASIRDGVGHGEPVLRIVRAATDRGLLLTAEQRAGDAFTALLPLIAVFCVGVGRLVHGANHHRPVGLLALELLVSVFVMAVTGAATPRRTPAGDRILASAHGITSPQDSAPHALTSAAAGGGVLVPAAVMGVALLGAEGIVDGDLRQALYGGLDGASGGGSGGGCGSGSCGCG